MLVFCAYQNQNQGNKIRTHRFPFGIYLECGDYKKKKKQLKKFRISNHNLEIEKRYYIHCMSSGQPKTL